jgi:hypothetical protein
MPPRGGRGRRRISGWPRPQACGHSGQQAAAAAAAARWSDEGPTSAYNSPWCFGRALSSLPAGSTRPRQAAGVSQRLVGSRSRSQRSDFGFLNTCLIPGKMERNPWWQSLSGPFPVWKGPKGAKPDGGGNVRGQGRVGRMLIHRAVFRRDSDGAVAPRVALPRRRGCASVAARSRCKPCLAQLSHQPACAALCPTTSPPQPSCAW